MRIFFVLEYLKGNGVIEIFLTMFFNELIVRGHEPHVFLPKSSEESNWEEHIPNVHYYINPIATITSGADETIEKCKGLSELFYQLKKPDVVVATNVPHTSLYARMALGYSSDIPLVSWLFHSPDKFNMYHFVNYADIHWTFSSDIEKKLQKIVTPSTKIDRIGLPVMVDVPPIELCMNPKRFLYIGDIDIQQRRLHVLFHTLARLPYDWKLDIFGTGPDKEILQDFATKLAILKQIQFHESNEDPWSEITRSTALVTTSSYEEIPMIAGEALARGIPIITTDCSPGIKDLIQHGNNGWIFNIDDIEQLTNVFHQFTNVTSEKLTQYGISAIQSIQKYSIDQVLERMKRSILSYTCGEKRIAL